MYIGYRGRNIEITSPTKLYSDDHSFIKVDDPGLLKISPDVLIADYEVVDGQLRHRSFVPASQELRIAMVTSFNNNCGMSTYAQYLVDQMRHSAKDVRVFAELVEPEPPANDPDYVVRCWNRQSGYYQDVIQAVRAYDPDVVYVQHEYGSFHNPKNWNSLIGHLSSIARTVVVLHSVYDHFDKLVFEAPCSEIITHSLSARDLLRKRGVDHCPIHYIPHGCLPAQETNDLRHGKLGAEPVIFQYGFGYQYKGWDTVLDIMEQLREKIPEAVYLGVFNVSNYSKSFHATYYNTLMTNIRARGLEGSVVIHKGFRSEPILLSYMKQARCNLFPYWNHHEWQVHGASGAVRLALASGTPTIVGDVPFFNEFKGYLPICSTVEQYVQHLEQMLTSDAYRELISMNTAEFIEERTWDKIAAWYTAVTPDRDFTAPVGRLLYDDE